MKAVAAPATFSPLMRGNPIETSTAWIPTLLIRIFQSPHAGQSHRNSAVSRVPPSCKATFSPLMRGNPIETARRTRENKPYQDFQSPHEGQSHRKLGMSPDLEERWSLSVPSCGAIPSKLRQ